MSKRAREHFAGDESRAVVEHKLRDAWHKERRFHHTRGFCFLLVWASALVLLDLLVDWLFLASYRTPGWSRMILLGLNAATLVIVLYRYWWRHLQRYDPIRVSLEFERKHPELKSLLVSYVQISDEALAETHGSPALAVAMRRQAVTTTRPMNFKEVISYRLLTRLLLFSACVLTLFAGLSVYKTPFFRTLLYRMLNPVSHREYPTRTVIERVTGDLTIQQGQAATITAVCSGEIPLKGWLYVRAKDGPWETLGFLKSGGDAFAYRFSNVPQSFDYYVRLGDDESGRHRVRVIPAPKVLERRILLKYPEHTNLGTQELDSYYVEVPEGTEVTWRMRLDQRLQSAEMLRNFQDANAMQVREVGHVVEYTRKVWESFDYQFRWKTAGHGFVYETPGSYTVNVIPDTAPEVEITQPLGDEKATVRKRLMVTYRATDDYGLSEARLIFSVGDGPEQTWKIGPLSGKDLKPSFEKKLAELIPNLAEDTVVTYCLEVADNRAGERGSNVSRSFKRRVFIVSVEEYLRSILEEQLRRIAEVEEMRVEEKEAGKEVGSMKYAETQPASQPSKP